MKVRAHLSNARMAPRKVRGLALSVVGMEAEEALAQLQWHNGKAARLVRQVMKSALANAKSNHDIAEDNLRVASIDVGKGMSFKRFRAVSRGMGHAYKKQNSHLTVTLEEISPTTTKKKKEKVDIDTLTVEELAKSEDKREEVGGQGKPEDKSDAAVGREADMDAFLKTKMRQRGGGKKMGYRRKSI